MEYQMQLEEQTVPQNEGLKDVAPFSAPDLNSQPIKTIKTERLFEDQLENAASIPDSDETQEERV